MSKKKTPSKMGRPKLADDVKKRLVWQIRLSEQEHKDLLDLAFRRETTAADLFREWMQRELDKEAKKG